MDYDRRPFILLRGLARLTKSRIWSEVPEQKLADHLGWTALDLNEAVEYLLPGRCIGRGSAGLYLTRKGLSLGGLQGLDAAADANYDGLLKCVGRLYNPNKRELLAGLTFAISQKVQARGDGNVTSELIPFCQDASLTLLSERYTAWVATLRGTPGPIFDDSSLGQRVACDIRYTVSAIIVEMNALLSASLDTPISLAELDEELWRHAAGIIEGLTAEFFPEVAPPAEGEKEQAEVSEARIERPDTTKNDPMSRQVVFLVHGHAMTLRAEVARFIEKLGLEVVVLDEKPNRGRTLLEKFEEHAQHSGFAVVLMTADDRCSGPKGDTFRARQNVVFELGFFFGRLERGRTCVIYESGVELPSDLPIAYVDATHWREGLFRELRAAGLAVSWPD